MRRGALEALDAPSFASLGTGAGPVTVGVVVAGVEDAVVEAVVVGMSLPVWMIGGSVSSDAEVPPAAPDATPLVGVPAAAAEHCVA